MTDDIFTVESILSGQIIHVFKTRGNAMLVLDNEEYVNLDGRLHVVHYVRVPDAPVNDDVIWTPRWFRCLVHRLFSADHEGQACEACDWRFWRNGGK